MNENDPSPKPTEIGGRTLRGLMIALTVDVVLLIATGVLAVGFDLESPDYWINGLAVTFGVLALLLIVVPAVVFLIHSLRYPERGVTPLLRRSATSSAIAPGLLGLALILLEGAPQIPGWILIGLAAAVTGRAWTARRAEADVEESFAGYTYSLVGLLLFYLASMAMPHGHLPGKAYLTAMKSDLRNLVAAEETYFEQHKRYTTDLTQLGFKTSTGVNAPKVFVGESGWHATITHSELSKTTCGIAVKLTNPINPTADNGEPACQ